MSLTSAIASASALAMKKSILPLSILLTLGLVGCFPADTRSNAPNNLPSNEGDVANRSPSTLETPDSPDPDLELVIETTEIYCPKQAEEAIGESIRRTAFLTTDNFQIYICLDSADAMYYYGVERENPGNSIILPVEMYQGTYIAKNADTRYQVDENNLAVYQGETRILFEDVIESQFTEYPAANVYPVKVAADGFGEIKIGMTVEEASKVSGQTFVTLEGVRPQLGRGCNYIKPENAPEGLTLMVIGRTITRMDITENTILTQAGVKVGDREKKIKSLYPNIKVSPAKYDPKGAYLTHDSGDGDYAIVFETDGQQVTRFRAGRKPEVEWVEGCG